MLLIQNAFKPLKLRGYERVEKFLDTRDRGLTKFNVYVIL